jgi:hypothetical protein
MRFDAADDRLERDRLQAEVALAAAAERRDHLVERQDHVRVIGFASQARGEDAQRAAPAHPPEIRTVMRRQPVRLVFPRAEARRGSRSQSSRRRGSLPACSGAC